MRRSDRGPTPEDGGRVAALVGACVCGAVVIATTLVILLYPSKRPGNLATSNFPGSAGTGRTAAAAAAVGPLPQVEAPPPAEMAEPAVEGRAGRQAPASQPQRSTPKVTVTAARSGPSPVERPAPRKKGGGGLRHRRTREQPPRARALPRLGPDPSP
jgi:hypothetical protein